MLVARRPDIEFYLNGNLNFMCWLKFLWFLLFLIHRRYDRVRYNVEIGYYVERIVRACAATPRNLAGGEGKMKRNGK